MIFVPSKETHDMVVDALLPHYQSIFKKNVDKLLPLSIYGTEEETLKRYDIHDLVRLINNGKDRGLDLYTVKKHENEKTCNIFEEYKIDDLKRLYKSYILFAVTEYMKYCKRYKYDCIEELYVTDGPYQDIGWRKTFNDINISTLEMLLKEDEYKDDKERISMQYRLTSLKVFNEILFWFDSNSKKTEENYDELHATDDEDIKYDRPTKWEIYLFIWNSLRFAPLDDLVKLNKLADKKFITRDPGRPAKNIPVYVFDKYGELVIRYNNRQECMETEGLGKQYMRQLLNGDKRRKKCTYVEMTDEKYKEYVDNFNNLSV